MYQLHYEDKKGAGCCKVLTSQAEVEKAMKSLARRHMTGILRLQNAGTIGSVEPTSDGVWNWWYDKDIMQRDNIIAFFQAFVLYAPHQAWNDLQSTPSYLEVEATKFVQEV
jgi:hypothetical protein